jgi:hypothetical protein
VANGVEYVDAPDGSCTAVDVLDGAVSMRREVTLFAQASDCQDRPLVGLTEKDLVAVEDGESANASVALRAPAPVAAFVMLLVDLNALKAAPTEVQAALRASIARVGSTTTRVGLSVYGGASEPNEIVAPTLDRDRLTKALDGLAGSFSAAKETPSFAALVSSATSVAKAARAFRDRNQGGAFGGSFLLWIPLGEQGKRGYAERAPARGCRLWRPDHRDATRRERGALRSRKRLPSP